MSSIEGSFSEYGDSLNCQDLESYKVEAVEFWYSLSTRSRESIVIKKTTAGNFLVVDLTTLKAIKTSFTLNENQGLVVLGFSLNKTQRFYKDLLTLPHITRK
jgi:hypothetical protein